MSLLHVLKLRDGDSGKQTQVVEAPGAEETAVSQAPDHQALGLHNIHKKSDALHTLVIPAPGGGDRRIPGGKPAGLAHRYTPGQGETLSQNKLWGPVR